MDCGIKRYVEQAISIVYDLEMLYYGNDVQMCSNVYGRSSCLKCVCVCMIVYVCIYSRLWIMYDSE